MQNIINHDLQEQAHSLVATKLSFLNPTTFDSDDDRVDFTGKDNVQWNLHHFIRSGKLCSNGFYACKSTLGYIYSISNNIVQAITSDSKESYVRLEKRLVLQQDRLENNIAELNIALAEYEQPKLQRIDQTNLELDTSELSEEDLQKKIAELQTTS